MNSKSFIFVALLFALVLYVSSTLAAEITPQDEKKEDNVKEPDYIRGGGGGAGRCRYGCCGRFRGYCNKCCTTATDEETKAAAEVSADGRGGDHCRYGCCGRWFYGRCRKCCKTEAEAGEVSVDNHEEAP